MKYFCRTAVTTIAIMLFALMCMCVPTVAAPITLPLPIHLENFDAVSEGGLPAGWSRTNHSTLPFASSNLNDLDSAPYAGWLVLERARFTSNFLTYAAHTPQDYSRVLSVNTANVVNGQVVTNLAQGRFMFCTSGWREGSQIQYLFSPDFNLAGKTNI